MPDKTERRAGIGLRIAFRVFLNTGLVWFLSAYFGTFFVIRGGLQAIALAGLILAAVNWLVIPILSVLSLPIKFFAWIAAFLLVNAAALWIAAQTVSALDLPGVSLAIEGGVAGWVVASAVLGLGNWVMKAILR